MSQQERTKSPEQTISLGEKMAKSLTGGEVICLQGALGTGKTHFVKGLAKGLDISPQNIQSPTYTLIQEHDGRLSLYHFDCYRIEAVEEALEIGAEEYFYGSGVCAIEWAERIMPLIPENSIWITIEEIDRTSRKFVIEQKGS